MRQKALITIVGNGGEMFKIWYRYYRQFFEPWDIYVLDFNSTDGSTDGLSCNVEAYPKMELNVKSIPRGNRVLNEFKSKLLQKYKYIVYADYDEILYHADGLDNFIDGIDQKYYNPLGFEIVQKRNPYNLDAVNSEEAPFDYSKTVMSQRAYWYRNISFDKPLITRMDFTWAQGNHTAYASLPELVAKKPTPDRHTAPPKNVRICLPKNYCGGLYLLHLKHIDYERCKKLYPQIDLRIHWLNLNRKLLLIPKPLRDEDIV